MTPNFKKTVSGNRFQELREEIEENVRNKIHYPVFMASGENLETILAALEIAERGQKIDGGTSDGYHTFNELYEHRCLLFLAWVTSDGRPGDTYWVADHYEGWDLVVTEVLGKQVSYHVPVKYRAALVAYLPCMTKEAHHWDGHTSADVIKRLEAYVLPPEEK